MNEDYIPFELAKKLKEKGYPQNCCHYYNEKGGIDIPAYNLFDESVSDLVAPTISQVLKWLRDEKGLHIVVELDHNHKYEWCIQHTSKMYGKMSSHFNNRHERFEHSALAAIEYAIKNLI